MTVVSAVATAPEVPPMLVVTLVAEVVALLPIMVEDEAVQPAFTSTVGAKMVTVPLGAVMATAAAPVPFEVSTAEPSGPEPPSNVLTAPLPVLPNVANPVEASPTESVPEPVPG